MLKIGGIGISDSLRLTIGNEAIQLRPAQGLRIVETLLRASTRMMMTEEAAKSASRSSSANAPKASPAIRRALRSIP